MTPPTHKEMPAKIVFCLFLAASLMTSFLPAPQGGAIDLLDPNISFSPVTDPFIEKTEVELFEASNEDSLFHLQSDFPLSLSEFVSSAALPQVKSQGYNRFGRERPFIGYVTLAAEERDSFFYHYDLGAAAGATVDIVLAKESGTMNLSAGFSLDLKRVNRLEGSPGLAYVHILFVDENGAEAHRDVALSEDWSPHFFNLDESGFDATHIKQVIMRQTYEDVDGDFLQEDRRGTVYVRLNDIAAPVPVKGDEETDLAQPFKPGNVFLTVQGFNREGGRIPGFITPHENSDGYAFAYDVGGTRDSAVRARLHPVPAPFGFPVGKAAFFMKNSGNGAKVRVFFENAEGGYAEFTVELHEDFRLYEFDLTDAFYHRGLFDLSGIAKVSIEVDRGLSPERRGRIDFQFAQYLDAQDPFSALQPAVQSAVRSGSKREIYFSLLEEASSYTVQIATDPVFQSVIRNGNFSSSPAVFTDVVNDGTYYVRVKGTRPGASGPVDSRWSETFVFEKQTSVFLLPETGLDGASLTVFPAGSAGELRVTSLGGGDALDEAHATSRGVLIHYNTGTNGFAGGGFTFDDFSTPAIENGDLSRLSELVFGIKASNSTLRLELVDADGQKAYAELAGISSAQEQFWRIPLSRFAGIDLTRVRIIYFIAEGNHQAGIMEINRIPSGFPLVPSGDLSAVDITPFRNPSEVRLVPAPIGMGSVVTVQERGFRFDYDTDFMGWAAGGFLYDPYVEPGTGDLSRPDGIILGLKGDAGTAKAEFKDAGGRSVSIYLTGIETSLEKFWYIPAAYLQAVDLSALSAVFFVVEGAEQSGTLEFSIMPEPRFILPDPATSPQEIPGLPVGTAGQPRITSVGPGGDAFDLAVETQRGVVLHYATAAPGWAGGGFTYDDFGTPLFETADLSGLEELVFGISGSGTDRVKFEIQDAWHNVASIILKGIQESSEQVWRIPVSLLEGIDLSQVRLLYFIVEGQDKSGSLEIYHRPLIS